MNNINKIINFGEISRIFSGTRSVISANRMPKIHKDKVNELKDLIKKWLLKHTNN